MSDACQTRRCHDEINAHSLIGSNKCQKKKKKGKKENVGLGRWAMILARAIIVSLLG